MNGQIGMLLADDGERLGAAEAGHRVVGDDEVPLGIVELAAQVVGGVDAAGKHVVAGARQRGSYQGRIVLGVFDLQKPERASCQTPDSECNIAQFTSEGDPGSADD